MEKKKPEEATQAPADAGSAVDDSDALENVESHESDDAAQKEQADSATKKSKKTGNILGRIASRINVYLLVFILIVIIALIVIFVSLRINNEQDAKIANIEAQELTQDAIDNLSSNEATVGDPKQLLNIESNAVFSGKVLIRDGLDVAGPIKVGGDLSLPGITVSGNSAFDEVQINTLSIAGDASVQGTLTVQEGLSVNGQSTFSGPISAPSIIVSELQLNGDIQFNRHIDAGGGTPGLDQGGALGAGGTATISGTDTAGTVTANIGAGAGGGLIASVTFTNSFTTNPHVVITPIGRAAPDTYVTNRTATGFSITTSSGLPAGSISFDYVVID